MQEWLDSPLIVVAIIAVLSVLGTIFTWVGRVNSDRENFKDFMKDVRGKLDRIFDRLPKATLQSESPLSLTPFGQKVSKHVAAKQWVVNIVADLLGRVKGQTEYEIEQFAMNYMRDTFVPDGNQKALLQKVAYDNGLGVDEVLRVIAVELRDALLAQKPSPEARSVTDSTSDA